MSISTSAVWLESSSEENLEPPAARQCGERALGNLDEIYQLQIKQREHDDLYHPEISRLPIAHRATHLSLHFAKYAGRIADAVGAGNDRDMLLTLTDTMIIAISFSNILNLRLDRRLQENLFASHEEGFVGFRFKYCIDELSALHRALSSASGRLAKACEALDHLEAFDYRGEMESAVIDIACLAFAHAWRRDLDVGNLVRQRLEGVRRKNVLHGHL